MPEEDGKIILKMTKMTVRKHSFEKLVSKIFLIPNLDEGFGH